MTLGMYYIFLRYGREKKRTLIRAYASSIMLVMDSPMRVPLSKFVALGGEGHGYIPILIL